MKILVCISKAPDTTSKIAFTDGGSKFDENGVQFIVNPYDEWYALVRALDAKKIAGCALDTVDPEPLPNPHPLRDRDNVILNPHAAWYSEQAMVGLQAGAPNEVKRVLSGAWPINVVNPAVRGKNRAGLK